MSTETRMTTQEVLDGIARERVRLMAALHGIDDKTVVTDEGWSAKDLLAHLIHWAGQIAWALGAPMTPPSYVASVQGRPTGDEWNALVVAHYRGASRADVLRDFDHAVDALIERVRLQSDERINGRDVIPWAGDRPLHDIIGHETFYHWPLHAADIERAARAR